MSYDPFDDEFFKLMRRMMREFDREFKGMKDKFKIDVRELERGPGVTGFKVEIRDFGKGKPEVKVTPLGKRPMRIAPFKAPAEAPVERPKPPKVERKDIKPVTRMLETNCGKIERLNEIVLTMQVPGVKKEDVEVRQLGNALEIIARKPSGEAYFGAFELPPDAAPSEREVELKEKMLIISIPRRRRPRMKS
jgi:HSP20 family molecular chaperone IbpA